MMAKMDKKTNWTKIKIYIGQKTNNFFFFFFFFKKNGPIVCKKRAYFRPNTKNKPKIQILKKPVIGLGTNRNRPVTRIPVNRDPIPDSGFPKPRIGVSRFRSLVLAKSRQTRSG
jgi:hypothetical protein